MKKIVFIGGPTASGKTDLAIGIAKKFNGEIINADSRQIYKYLDIGTNKGKIKNIDGQNYIDDIPIHLVSFLNPDQRFSVYDFKQKAIALIEQILSEGKLPILAGGTGLYIDSIIKDYSLSADSDLKLRAELESKTTEELKAIVIENNKTEFNNLNDSDKNNPRRLVRLIEKSNTSSTQQESKCDYDYLFLYPEYNWEDLTKKIETRVEQMFKNGLVDEVQNILNLGFVKDCVGLQGTGYKEVVDLLDNKFDLNQCIKLVKTSHRQYAKRQRTWFEGTGRNYNLTKVENIEQAELKVSEFQI